jgi:glycosyltransferase involved in cell wall biosynthesis
MMDSPMISVLLPVYNAERYVAEAVQSILDQTFDDFEFLIVDDGSTDSSRAILEEFAARDRRIRLVSRPNTGYVVALNEMLGRARGELVARMDADDAALPERFERQLAYLAEHPECLALGSRVTVIDPEGLPLAVMTDLLEHDEIERALLVGLGAAIYHPSVMFRKKPVLELGGYRKEYYLAEDLDLFLRLGERGRLANLAEPLLRYREHMSKVGRSRVEQQRAAARGAIAEAHRRRGLPPPEGVLEGESRIFNPAEVSSTWAWWALGSGYPSTARKHAMASLTRNPFSPATWKLLLCTIRGR